jgi:hypothetical protein
MTYFVNYETERLNQARRLGTDTKYEFNVIHKIDHEVNVIHKIGHEVNVIHKIGHEINVIHTIFQFVSDLMCFAYF